MNKIMLVGNIVKDSELKLVGKEGTAKATFTLAINKRIKDREDKVTFVPCVIWGKMAEALCDYLVKGTKVAVVGELDINNVESEEYEGEWKTYVNVNVNELDFCGGKKQESEEKTKSGKKPPRKAKKERA